jgi:hypothetical protein
MEGETRWAERPTREQMELGAAPPEPPPDREEIRRQLGWYLLLQNARNLTDEDHDDHRS